MEKTQKCVPSSSNKHHGAFTDQFRPEIPLFLRLMLLFPLIVQVAGCATTDNAFRSSGPAMQECDIYANNRFSTGFQDARDSKRKLALMETEVIPAANKCYEQRDALILESKNQLGKSQIKYQLNFLEFKENGELRSSDQWFAVERALKQHSGPKFVIVFIHGWRHDARLDDSNVQSFRTMLAYSARNLHDRQNIYGSDAQVFGIYMGWPGNVWKWNWIDALHVPTFFTFWNRKKVSEQVAPHVRAHIHAIRALLNQNGEANDLDRLLIVGHSFGGNLAIRALKEDYKQLIPDDGRRRVAPLQGVSDLTVLLNPASEFSNWKEIQEAEYTRSGYLKIHDGKPDFANYNKFFDARQKPILMSITSVCDWREGGISHNACDFATGRAFPVAQFLNFHTNPDEYRALGHVRPYRYLRSEVPGPVYGITHELEDNTDKNKLFAPFPTSYANAASERYSCPNADDWLGKAQKDKQDQYGRAWDTLKLDIPGVGGYQIQMRHGSFRSSKQNKNAIESKSYTPHGPAYQPFWNVASHDSIVPDHNTVFSKQLLCLFSQIVLDSLTEGE